MDRRIKIVLLGLEFDNGNKGCEALSYSFSIFLNDLLDELKITAEYVGYVYKADIVPCIPGSTQTIILRKIRFKNINFWLSLRRECKEADYIFDFTGGDSFSDIYGFKRFFLGSLVKLTAISSKKPFILGPQTYGVFKKKKTEIIAKRIIEKSYAAYARDQYSIDYLNEITSKKVYKTTDIAFLLPYTRAKIEHNGKLIIGFNPSGLLWNGGYNHKNQFGLKTDYQQYCIQLIGRLCNDINCIIYLIPHVGNHPDDSCENDANACQILHNLYPENTIALYDIKTPMDIKGNIAALDVFIGARMHATIAAFSSKIATIPFSYSRKFEGLYNNLCYNYCINGREMSTEEAVEKTYKYIIDYEKLQKNVIESMSIVEKYQSEFKTSIIDIVNNVK